MSNLSDEQLFYANIDKIIDGELDPSLAGKLEPMTKDSEYSSAVGKFKEAHGKLQNILEGQFLTENENLVLRGHVQDMKELAHVEEEEIERLGAANRLQKLTRNTIFYGVLIFIGYSIATFLMPSEGIEFDPIESLSYETLAIEETLYTDLSERIDMQTSSIGEVAEFISNSRSVKDFSGDVMSPKGWSVEGVSVLDYDVTQIALVLYSKVTPGSFVLLEEEVEEFDESGNPLPVKTVETKIPRKEILAHYMFKSDKDSFDKSAPGKLGKFDYYSFSSERLNFVMWKKGDVYNVLAGERSATEMAKMASAK